MFRSARDILGGVPPELDPDFFVRRSTRRVEGLRDAKPDTITTNSKASRCSHDRKKWREPVHLERLELIA